MSKKSETAERVLEAACEEYWWRHAKLPWGALHHALRPIVRRTIASVLRAAEQEAERCANETRDEAAWRSKADLGTVSAR